MYCFFHLQLIYCYAIYRWYNTVPNANVILLSCIDDILRHNILIIYSCFICKWNTAVPYTDIQLRHMRMIYNFIRWWCTAVLYSDVILLSHCLLCVRKSNEFCKSVLSINPTSCILSYYHSGTIYPKIQ